MSSQNTGACSVALCKEKAVVVVVVDDYTYYWVTLRPSISSLLKSATSVITKGERYYKVRQNGRFEKKARTQQKMHGVSPTNLLEFRKRETF